MADCFHLTGRARDALATILLAGFVGARGGATELWETRFKSVGKGRGNAMEKVMVATATANRQTSLAGSHKTQNF